MANLLVVAISVIVSVSASDITDISRIEIPVIRKDVGILSMFDVVNPDECSSFIANITSHQAALRNCSINHSRCKPDCRKYYEAAQNLPMSKCISLFRSRGKKLTLAYIRRENEIGKTFNTYCNLCSSFSNKFDTGILLDRECRNSSKTCGKSCLKSYSFFKNLTAPRKICLVGYTISGVQATEANFHSLIETNTNLLENCRTGKSSSSKSQDGSNSNTSDSTSSDTGVKVPRGTDDVRSSRGGEKPNVKSGNDTKKTFLTLFTACVIITLLLAM